MVIRRDKPLQSYTPIDFVKYFARKYKEVNREEYDINYARDAVLMSQIVERFVSCNRTRADILKFVDEMFDEYPKRVRSEPIDVRFLLATCHLYLHGKESKRTKVKTPSFVSADLTQEIREWLAIEKKKWLGGK
jgi:hypothetical protein